MTLLKLNSMILSSLSAETLGSTAKAKYRDLPQQPNHAPDPDAINPSIPWIDRLGDQKAPAPCWVTRRYVCGIDPALWLLG
jgi:hypothetical protein